MLAVVVVGSGVVVVLSVVVVVVVVDRVVGVVVLSVVGSPKLAHKVTTGEAVGFSSRESMMLLK